MDPTLLLQRTICSIEGDDGSDAGGADTNGAEPNGTATEAGSNGFDVGAIAQVVAEQVMSHVRQVIDPLSERVNSMPTQDSMNAAIRRATKGKGGSESTTGSEPAKPSSKGDNGSTDAWRAEFEALRFENAFNKATRGLTLTAEQEDLLMTAAKAKDPDDLQAWVAATVKSLGFGQSSSPESKTEPEAQAKPAKTEPAPKPATPPVSDGGSPAQPITNIDEITNPAYYTQDVFERLVAKHGLRKAQKMVRETSERYYRNVRVVPELRR